MDWGGGVGRRMFRYDTKKEGLSPLKFEASLTAYFNVLRY
jgi:hypothetical protein